MPADANPLIDSAFAEIAHIHRLMSFHEPSSDVSRMNRMTADRPVRVHADTHAVLCHALELSRASSGVFDISVADRLVAAHHLPTPHLPTPPVPTPVSGHLPDPDATWRDIELIEPDLVRFHRPLWVDLGGIAKGYAVDRAMEKIADDADVDWCINAGGDLRVAGPSGEQVLLRNLAREGEPLPIVRLQNAALASSGGLDAPDISSRPHIHGQTRLPIGSHDFVSVIAAQCMTADALTKVVLAQAKESDAILKAHGAAAFLHRPETGWARFGAAP